MKLSNFFSNPPVLAKYLFVVLAALLVTLAFMSFMRVNGGDISQTIQYATNALMLFIDAAVMLFFAFRIGTRKKQIYQFAVVILAINIILTIFNQFDVAGIVFILINVLTLYVLLVYREEFTDSAVG